MDWGDVRTDNPRLRVFFGNLNCPQSRARANIHCSSAVDESTRFTHQGGLWNDGCENIPSKEGLNAIVEVFSFVCIIRESIGGVFHAMEPIQSVVKAATILSSPFVTELVIGRRD